MIGSKITSPGGQPGFFFLRLEAAQKLCFRIIMRITSTGLHFPASGIPFFSEMNLSKAYGGLVRKCLVKDPAKARALVIAGLRMESIRKKLTHKKEEPEALLALNRTCLEHVASALGKPDKLVCTNIFAPTEILQNFSLQAVSMECLASFLSGFYLEDYLIDAAEAMGLASTLCSYHKNFIGALETGLLPKPLFGLTTSTFCDGNVGTFRLAEQKYGIEMFMIDVPNTCSDETEKYVTDQLRDLIGFLEDKTGKKFDIDELRRCLDRENQSKAHYMSFLEKRKKHSYPSTLTLELFMLFANHIELGMPWVLDFYRKMDEEVEKMPCDDGKRFFWVHLLPYYEATLQGAFNLSKEHSVVTTDFSLDYIEPMDLEHPLEALSRKMLLNNYNGSFERKAALVAKYAKELECDAVIQFCHWGCKQSCGGVQMMKERMREEGIPMLALDGDALDRRGTFPGQVKTRFEAFLEMLEGGEE